MQSQLINLTPLALSLIAILGLVVTTKVIPVLKSKLTASQRQQIMDWINIAVKAAEQLCKDGRLDPAERKQHVLDDVREWLEAYGFTVDFKEIDDMIEAVVNELPKTFVKEDSNESN